MLGRCMTRRRTRRISTIKPVVEMNAVFNRMQHFALH